MGKKVSYFSLYVYNFNLLLGLISMKEETGSNIKKIEERGKEKEKMTQD